ncbi:MAG: zinc dependent phospholipase C family protein [Syntrophobacteraceae bacterium]|nr:zinc dependent phospholipase C family protein [Syntrophobacteraceae bacterium]
MPKERFHIYLAKRLAGECETGPPIWFDRAAFLLGAVSPDIFYYDLPFFSLTPLGDRIHGIIERDGISIISEWISSGPISNEPNSKGPNSKEPNSKEPNKGANGAAISWGLGVASHFMADALWHPLIEDLSSGGLSKIYGGARRLSPLERHRLIESEIEAFWLARNPEANKSDYLALDFGGKRGRILAAASHYLSFLEFAGLGGQDLFFSPRARGAVVSKERISWCFSCQNFLLKLFSNRTLGGQRDLLLSIRATRFLGALVAPVHPVLPALFALETPEHLNPFSDFFMDRAVRALQTDWRALIEKIEEGEKKKRRKL